MARRKGAKKPQKEQSPTSRKPAGENVLAPSVVPVPPPPNPVGLPCRHCGCPEMRVEYTRRRGDGRIVRRRACRHCGHGVITIEREAGA